MDPEIPEPQGPVLAGLVANPDALRRLVRFYNAHRKLEIHVTQSGVTQKFTVSATAENAVVKITL